MVEGKEILVCEVMTNGMSHDGVGAIASTPSSKHFNPLERKRHYRILRSARTRLARPFGPGNGMNVLLSSSIEKIQSIYNHGVADGHARNEVESMAIYEFPSY